MDIGSIVANVLTVIGIVLAALLAIEPSKGRAIGTWVLVVLGAGILSAVLFFWVPTSVRWWLTAGFVTFGSGGFGGWRLSRRYPRQANGAVSNDDTGRRDAARRLVTGLHRRWFPKGPALDPAYRVSLFMPHAQEGKTALRCIARTILPAEQAAVWPTETDVERKNCAGLVNYAFTEGLQVEVAGVPVSQRADHNEVERYRSETCLNETLHDKRSWKWASLLVRFARGGNGLILCVIVVEREDGEPIELTKCPLRLFDSTDPARGERDLCAWELQLAVEVWAALRDHQ